MVDDIQTCLKYPVCLGSNLILYKCLPFLTEYKYIFVKEMIINQIQNWVLINIFEKLPPNIECPDGNLGQYYEYFIFRTDHIWWLTIK